MIDRTNEFIARIALNIYDKPVEEQRAVLRNYDNIIQVNIMKAMETMKSNRSKKNG